MKMVHLIAVEFFFSFAVVKSMNLSDAILTVNLNEYSRIRSGKLRAASYHSYVVDHFGCENILRKKQALI